MALLVRDFPQHEAVYVRVMSVFANGVRVNSMESRAGGRVIVDPLRVRLCGEQRSGHDLTQGVGGLEGKLMMLLVDPNRRLRMEGGGHVMTDHFTQYGVKTWRSSHGTSR